MEVGCNGWNGLAVVNYNIDKWGRSSTVAMMKISNDIRNAPKHMPTKMAKSLKPCIAFGFVSGSSLLISVLAACWPCAELLASCSDLVVIRGSPVEEAAMLEIVTVGCEIRAEENLYSSKMSQIEGF